ncbi:MAG TPA: asparagine synthase-related protein [Pyrinomonadaceae bacterium]|nr:asparagine synthase-related protein [Pyrinomonadaceae bacterium]
MTLIAGIFNRQGQPLADAVCRELAQSLSRQANEAIETIRKPEAFFAKLDIGAFNSKGAIENTDAVSLLTGEPLLDGSTSRAADLSRLHEELLQRNRKCLSEPHGTFTLVHYQSQTPSLTLVSDKCAVRPLYFWISDEAVVFASALRVIEACSLVPKKMDLRGVTEMVALGTTLNGRTPYVGVSRMKPGQIITVSRHHLADEQYWRWDEVVTSADSEASRLEAVHTAFGEAVDRRLGVNRSTSAFLSGGLDSRLVVASLRERETKVHTVNFALPGTQDQFLGDEFARRVGSIHQSIPRQAGDSVPDYSQLMCGVIEKTDIDCERPRLVWSGEGGSVMLGLVHVTGAMIQAMRQNRIAAVVDEFVQTEATQVPTKLFRSHVLDNAMEIVRQGISEELSGFHADDPGRNVCLFLLANDQSQKLNSHFENIDLHRLEFQLPFFDGALLRTIFETRVDWLLQHKFYNQLLPRFGEIVTRVPWQAYPGHEACSLPIPEALAYQWNDDYQTREHAAKRKRMVARASQLLRGVDFPTRILDRRKLRLASWIHATGWRDYQYAIEAAETYSRYSAICRGEFSLSLS